jgi:hypothetical protein
VSLCIKREDHPHEPREVADPSPSDRPLYLGPIEPPVDEPAMAKKSLGRSSIETSRIPPAEAHHKVRFRRNGYPRMRVEHVT